MLVEVGNLRELVPTMLANQRQKILDRSPPNSPNSIRSAWSRNWSCWRRRAMSPRSWTASPPTSARSAVLPAAPPVGAWTS